MIDEKAREIATKTKYLVKSAISEIKTTLGCLMSVYFDRVRWVEFTALVMPPALIAGKLVAGTAFNWASPYIGFAVGLYIALTYLRNPKMENWQNTPTVTVAQCEKESPDA